SKNCLGCHGKEAKGGLNLSTFADMRKGGKNGPLLIEGDGDDSLLIGRLLAAPELRMPKDGEPLAETDIRTICEWINQGAKFDGSDETAPLNKLVVSTPSAVAMRKDSLPKSSGAGKTPAVARPTGSEKVSFTKDIAPFMVERCVRCHGGDDPKGGLSLET